MPSANTPVLASIVKTQYMVPTFGGGCSARFPPLNHEYLNTIKSTRNVGIFQNLPWTQTKLLHGSEPCYFSKVRGS